MGQLELRNILRIWVLGKSGGGYDDDVPQKSSDDKGESNEDFIRMEELQSMDAQTASIIRTSRMRPNVSNRQKDPRWI